MSSGWILRGPKTERIVVAAVIDGALAAMAAWSAGKDPVLHGVTHALAGAEAMSHHRLEDRLKAHERNGRLAEASANMLEQALSRRDAATPALA